MSLMSLSETLAQIAEIACSEAASAVLNDISSRTKIPGLHMAAAVPGVCHDHPPTTNLVEGCAYCARNGNVFSADETTADAAVETDDVVARYVREVEKTLTDLANAIAVRLETDKNVAVNATKATLADMELERMLMDALDDCALNV
jgi:glutamate racemase